MEFLSPPSCDSGVLKTPTRATRPMNPCAMKIQGQERNSKIKEPIIGEIMGARAMITETWLSTFSRLPLSSRSLAMANEMEEAAPAPMAWIILAPMSIQILMENAQRRLARIKRSRPITSGGLRPKRSDKGP